MNNNLIDPSNCFDLAASDDKEPQPVPRRCMERRAASRRRAKVTKQLRAIDKLNDLKSMPIRIKERRQTDRRQSRPMLLSVEKIKALRSPKA